MMVERLPFCDRHVLDVDASHKRSRFIPTTVIRARTVMLEEVATLLHSPAGPKQKTADKHSRPIHEDTCHGYLVFFSS